MADRRIVLKLSGELLCEPGASGIDPQRLFDLAGQVKKGTAGGGQLALVLGGGNFLRGARLSASGIDRVTGDRMGMIATVMNALALRSALLAAGVEARLLSAIPMADLVEPFDTEAALEHLAAGRVLLLAGGTGHPYFTTDTTAALRALEIGASLVAKGTKVRGVFAEDPVRHPGAEFFERLSFEEVLEKRLKVMDATAISLCMEHRLPIQVFNMWERGNMEKVLQGERIGTMIE